MLHVSAMFMMHAILCAIPHEYFLKNLSRWTFEDYIKKDKKGAEKEIEPLILASKCFKTRSPAKSTVLNDDELKSIKTPALFMVGENEKLYPAQKAVKRFNTLAPRIQTEIVPNAGHDLCKVQAEMVNEKVLEFLK